MKYGYVVIKDGALDLDIVFPTMEQAELAIKMLYTEKGVRKYNVGVTWVEFFDIEKELKKINKK